MAAVVRGAAAAAVGTGVAIAVSGGRASPAYTYVADAAVGIMTLLDPEDAHTLTIQLARAGVLPKARAPASTLSDKATPSLGVKLWGLEFPNPVGLSAGFDKNAEVMAPLVRPSRQPVSSASRRAAAAAPAPTYALSLLVWLVQLQLGFGFVEIGGVTPLPQTGNPKPRVFRLPEDGAIINRIGLNSEGHGPVAARLANFRIAESGGGPSGIISVNLAKNTDSESAEADYCAGVRALGPHVDILVANVSCVSHPDAKPLWLLELF